MSIGARFLARPRLPVQLGLNTLAEACEEPCHVFTSAEEKGWRRKSVQSIVIKPDFCIFHLVGGLYILLHVQFKSYDILIVGRHGVKYVYYTLIGKKKKSFFFWELVSLVIRLFFGNE